MKIHRKGVQLKVNEIMPIPLLKQQKHSDISKNLKKKQASVKYLHDFVLGFVSPTHVY